MATYKNIAVHRRTNIEIQKAAVALRLVRWFLQIYADGETFATLVRLSLKNIFELSFISEKHTRVIKIGLDLDGLILLNCEFRSFLVNWLPQTSLKMMLVEMAIGLKLFILFLLFRIDIKYGVLKNK